MRKLSGAFTAVLVLGLIVGAGIARAADRVALVIGNGAYQKVASLPNPPRDANDVADSLVRLGFTVTRAANTSGADLRRALTTFGRAATGAEMAVVFYAGHGIEVGGENWLIPVDAELQSDADTENEAVSLKAVTQQVAKARQFGLVILDACRNNPFDAKMARASPTRAVARGLARVEPTGNVLVAYASKDGTTASDGDSRNSPFTTALLRNIETPGLEIGYLFRNIRDDVMKMTGQQQQPFIYGSLSRDAIYFKPPGDAGTRPQPVMPAPLVATPPADEVLWDLVKGSQVAASFEEFLNRYPASSYARSARARLDALKTQQQAALTPPGTTDSAPPPPKDPDRKLSVAERQAKTAALFARAAKSYGPVSSNVSGLYAPGACPNDRLEVKDFMRTFTVTNVTILASTYLVWSEGNKYFFINLWRDDLGELEGKPYLPGRYASLKEFGKFPSIRLTIKSGYEEVGFSSGRLLFSENGGSWKKGFARCPGSLSGQKAQIAAIIELTESRPKPD